MKLIKPIIIFILISVLIISCFLIYSSSRDNAVNEMNGKSFNVIPFSEDFNHSFFDVYNLGDYGQIAYGATSSDFNNDGFDDFAVSYATGNHSTISIFFNNGKNIYIRKDVCIFNYSLIDSLDAGDYDNDGDMDLVFSFSYHNNRSINVCGQVVMLFNEGDCNFRSGKNIIKIGNESDEIDTRHSPRITSGDYDNDGDIDIITGDMSGNVELFINDGKANFNSSKDIYDFGFASCGLSSVDYDNDGDIDVLIIASNDESDYYNGKIYLKENTGGINLSNNETTDVIATISKFVNSASISSMDYDGDGDIDFIIGIMNRIYLYRNDGGVFNPLLICILPSSDEGFGDNMTYGGLASGDFNNDGFDDFIAGGSLGVLRTFINNK